MYVMRVKSHSRDLGVKYRGTWGMYIGRVKSHSRDSVHAGAGGAAMHAVHAVHQMTARTPFLLWGDIWGSVLCAMSSI